MKAQEILEQLEALRDMPRAPGWDRKMEAQTIKLIYGSVEKFLQAQIDMVKDRIWQDLLAERDEE